MFLLAQLVMSNTDRVNQTPPAQNFMVETKDGSAANGFGYDQLVIDRDGSGQFHLVAQVNGFDTRFLVDTGADIVALTVDDAQKLGLFVDRHDFEPVTKTASGIGYGKRVRLDRIEVGGTRLSNVDGVIIDGLSVNLLGQSVLRRLGKVELSGDRMTIHHQ